MKLVPKLPPEAEAKDALKDLDVRAAFVETFGPRCAAWLVNRFRKKVRAYGVIPLFMSASEEVPPWFQIATSYLERSRKWEVDVQVSGGVRSYRIRWLYVRMREVPAALRPVS